MKQLSLLPCDTRFDKYSEFTQKMMHCLALDDVQVDSVLNDSVHIIKHPSITTVANFLKQSEALMVCGDYDADGVLSTTIALLLAEALKVKKTGYYIPDRFKEGYGVKKHTIQLAHSKGYTDILIVDNGVKASEEIDYALSLGLNVAVVDHHLIEKPLNCPLLHSDFLNDYGKSMCATGLMILVAEELGLISNQMLAYGAVATIADVMPLWGKNREIVKRGLEVMNTQRVLALDLLANGSMSAQYTAKDVAFKIIPKINSVGRMADLVNMNTMVEYLRANDEELLRNYAKQVLSVNDFRKKKGKENLEYALQFIDGQEAQVISSPHFHEGILGIVANQLVQKIGHPTIMLKDTGTIYKGSARSNSISLKELFDQLNPHYFEAFGGHDFAFGMSVKRDAFTEFKRDVKEISLNLPVIKEELDPIVVDIPITQAMIEDVMQLEPFGTGFQLPLLEITLPESFNVFALNGYGFKFVFNNFWLKDAVYFQTSINRNTLLQTKSLIGSLNVDPRYGISFNVEKVIL